MHWLHLSQTSSVRNTSDGGGPRLERVPGRSEQGKPWRGPPTWAAFICLDCFLGLRMITLPRSGRLLCRPYPPRHTQTEGSFAMTLSQKSVRSTRRCTRFCGGLGKVYKCYGDCCVLCLGVLREQVQRFRTSGSAFEHFNP